MDITDLIDRCVGGYGEMDIATIIITILKDKLPKGKDLYTFLNNEAPVYFLNRANYWHAQIKLDPDMIDRYHNKSMKLTEIALKFKQTNFKKIIMKEIEYLTSN